MSQETVFNISKGKNVSDSSIESNILLDAQNGDADAFGAIYDRYFENIFKFLYYRTSHKQTAEDLTEEVFLKAFKALGSLKGGSPKLRGWLFQIARNLLIDHYRKTTVTVNIEELESLESFETTAIDTLQLQSEEVRLLKALSSLPQDQQTVVKLRFLEEFEISEIAELLGKSEGNIRILQFRALTKLREHFKDRTNFNQ